MRKLTGEEIEKFAKRGVKRIAVENFLASLGEVDSKQSEILNLHADASIYGWNKSTIRAIHDGINLAYN